MDNDTNALAAALKAHVDSEAELFSDLGGAVERLRSSLEARSWGPGLAVAQAIEQSAAAIERAEVAREQAFEALRDALDLPRETAFSAVLPSVPEGQRQGLEESWRRLRSSVVRLKTASSRTHYAADALSEALNRILEQVFPYRKGKIYSRRGKATSVSGALLVDRRQ